MPKEHTEWTREDIYIGGFLALFFIILPLILSLPERSESHRDQNSEITYRKEQQSGDSKQQVFTHSSSKSKEDALIDKLDRDDYYEYSDYHDGLDGENCDIDFEEVSEYFRD